MEVHTETNKNVGAALPVVLIVDNSRVGWQRVSKLLEEVCLPGQIRSTTSVRGAMTKIRKLRPEIVILDIDMPARRGFEFIKTVRLSYPFLRIIILTSESDSYYRQRCREEGIDFFFDKATEAHHIPEVIRCLLQETTNN